MKKFLYDVREDIFNNRGYYIFFYIFLMFTYIPTRQLNFNELNYPKLALFSCIVRIIFVMFSGWVVFHVRKLTFNENTLKENKRLKKIILILEIILIILFFELYRYIK